MVSTRLKVKEFLRERRWTTKVLAEKTGMSESYLTHIKNGTRRWNEDALKKLAEAFEVSPTDLLEQSFGGKSRPVTQSLNLSEFINNDELAQNQSLDLKLKIVPIVGQIPSQPSEVNNQATQIATGFKNQFVPVFGINDNNMFCLSVDDNLMTPIFEKGDLLVVSPDTWTNSGDIVAVEYGNETPIKAIMQINFMDNIVVLETVNHKKAPLALTRGKDQFRIIGKVIFRFQKL